MGKWFKKFGDGDWWFGKNSMFSDALGTITDSGIVGQFAGAYSGAGVPVAGSGEPNPSATPTVDPMIIYGVGGLLLLKMFKVI